MSKLRINDEAQIYDNKARINRLEVEMQNQREDTREIKDDIKMIKNNHLSHIQKSIEDINLKLARLDPQNKITEKVIEYIILTIVIAGVTFLLNSRM